ncbi:MAG: hypothetical protein P0111_00260 [Nitrospira sp.]|nr:hypothetical protein [Nitrospira sp.]
MSGPTRAEVRLPAGVVNRPRSGRLRRSALAAVLCLCLCIMIQLLGVAGTWLIQAPSSELLGTSILEGFPIPTTAVQPPPVAAIVAAQDTLSSLHLPVLTLTLFHPPLR